MKMKKACEATGLTERAIRLYLSKNLIAPRQVNGVLDFSAEDIQHLKDIAVLRQFDFTIEQIASMISDAGTILDILRFRLDAAKTNIDHENEVCEILGKLEGTSFDSVHAVAAQIREQRMEPPEPDFCRFDEITDEERRQQRLVAVRDLSRTEKRTRLLRSLIVAACVAAVIAAAAAVYLSQIRIEGFISVAPLTVVKINSDEWLTICTGNAEAIGTMGRDTVMVPYRVFDKALEEGETLPHACQLAISLTNFDLLKMGISPLQTMQTGSAEVNDEWLRYVVRTMFKDGASDRAMLWIREIANMNPLFLWKAQ